MESLIDFVKFFGIVVILLFSEASLGSRLCLFSTIKDFLKFPHFLRFDVLSSLAARETTRTFSFW